MAPLTKPAPRLDAASQIETVSRNTPVSPAKIRPLIMTAQASAMKSPDRQSVGRSLLGVAVLGAIGIAYQSLSTWQAQHGIFINASESLPNWAFLVEAGKFPARGQYVLFKPGRDPLVIKHFGQKPGPFAKIAYGVPGDTIARDGVRVLVNGRQVSTIKPFTRQGEVLIPGPTGTVPRGCIFAGTPHKDGFDSRYAEIGFVCRDRLIGVGEPIL
jgi:conjugal transfer pilin signal peptidase TrbI